jgi:hypothetical protein
LDFIAHPEISSVIVEHLIQTRVPMDMHDVVKAEDTDLKTQVKTATVTVTVDKLESKLGRQATVLAKFQQEMKTALKNDGSVRPS